MPSSTSDIREAVRARALAEGFDAVRFVRAAAPPDAAGHLSDFLAQGFHGTMDWMARNADRRADPAVLWPEAKSIVVLGANYGPDHDPLDDLNHLHTGQDENANTSGRDCAPAVVRRPRGAVARSATGVSEENQRSGTISVYARGDDYHDVLKKRLKSLAHFITATFGGDAKVFVDTAPVLEKALAQQAGLGWQGKHTNLVSRDFGSWLFLGSVFTTLEIAPDEPETDHCGHCHACLDVCPTKAFPAPYRLDARRCISYLTIEHKGHIPREFRDAIGNRIYGCDDCLSVCPWNKFAQVSREARFAAREALQRPALSELARLDDAAFRALFRASPIKRIGRDRFVRNVLIAIGNSGDPDLAAEAERLLTDPSPLVRAMAVWALAKLTDAFAALAAKHRPAERDPAVCEEWDARKPQPRATPAPKGLL